MKWILIWPAVSVFLLVVMQDDLSSDTPKRFVGILFWPFLVPVLVYVAAKGSLKYLIEQHKEFLAVRSDQVTKEETVSRVIHASHPNGQGHPFKFTTLCGKMVRFGSSEIPGERPVSCKLCLKILKTLCPTCRGTGVVNE